MKVSFGYGSDARVRGENQDAHGVFEIGDLVLAVVCDGVGGHTGGQQAATLAVRTVAQAFQDGVTDVSAGLIEAITLANRTIYEAGRKSHRLMGMSTTIVAVAIRDDIAYVAHVGDSRAYLTRGTEIMPLTRDHTMVNMFVDNDLLSPEDAASHPEAHVLARSLGSERQVDVDAHEPISLEDSDVLLLCTDGLHGVVEESDLVSADWSRPGTAARQLLRRVAALGGNDNATAVGLRIGGRGEPGMLPTPIPSLEGGGDALTPSSSDLVHAPDLLNEPMPPALYPIEPEDEPTAYTEDPTDQSADDMVRRQPTPSSPLPPRVTPRTPAPAPMRPAQPTPPPRRRILFVAGGAAALSIVILGAAVVWRLGPGAGPASIPVDPTADDIAAVAGSTTDPNGPVAVNDRQGDQVLPSIGGTNVQPAIDQPADREWNLGSRSEEVDITHGPDLWLSIKFPAVKKNSKVAARFTNPVPEAGARVTIRNLVQEGRGCGEVESVVTNYVRRSSDAAPLFATLWHCYQDLHESRLEGELKGHHEFELVRRHLEGESLEQPVAGKTLPYWYLQANDGIERRMDLFDEHAQSSDLLFDDVVLDSIDESIVASRFHHDLVAECAFALAFRDIRNPTASQVADWARRVYVVRKHLDSQVGELIEHHHPMAKTRIRQLLASATDGFEQTYSGRLDAYLRENPGADTSDFKWQDVALELGLPVEVARALMVGMNEQTSPTGEPDKPETTAPRPRVDKCVVDPSHVDCIPK